MNVVLIEPEIPWNTGNIGRTCLAMGAELHIVGQPGFFLHEKDVQRAGLDYWKHVQLHFHKNLEEYFSYTKEKPFYFFSAKGSKLYTKIKFSAEDSLIFGKESEGLGQEIIEQYKDDLYFIPVRDPVRSLNLSTVVGIVLYEALRQFQKRSICDEVKRVIQRIF